MSELFRLFNNLEKYSGQNCFSQLTVEKSQVLLSQTNGNGNIECIKSKHHTTHKPHKQGKHNSVCTRTHYTDTIDMSMQKHTHSYPEALMHRCTHMHMYGYAYRNNQNVRIHTDECKISRMYTSFLSTYTGTHRFLCN